VLSIVIVTRNTKDILQELLLSIELDQSIKSVLKETIVVDNGSIDGTIEMLSGHFPWVTHVYDRENMGFAAAVNRGYRCSSGDLVLLLNSDTRLIPGELLKMIHHFEQNKTIGIIGPQLVYEDMKPQRSYATPPSLVTEVVPKFVLEILWPRRFGGKGAGAKSPAEVESLIGAAILVKRKVLDRLAGFDERFFFFLEETDFCLRARRQGFGVVFFPGSRTIHLQGKTVKKSWIPGRLEYAISLYKFIGKYHSGLYYSTFMAVRCAKSLLFVVPTTVLPFLLLKDSTKRKYVYYLRLLLWHFRGCPDDEGLRH
jgi:N-acetylglucosaminyl-diphospho-decaprenol L-rhamnosyltransferase